MTEKELKELHEKLGEYADKENLTFNEWDEVIMVQRTMFKKIKEKQNEK